jgi:RHS repeat-associated protein
MYRILQAVTARMIRGGAGYILAVLAGLFAAPHGDAQVSSMRVSVPSPTVASLGKFGDVPVSLYSGTPDVSIPLFTARGRTLELPIVLRYGGGGVRVEDVGGWAGIGWALEAGGAITRSVRGIPDDDYDGFLYTGSQFYSGTNWYAPSQSFVENLRDGFQDSQPDQYFFSFAGRSGQFIYGPDSTSLVVRSTPYQKLRIEPVIGARGDPITAFVITTEDGSRYTFGASETTTDQTINAPLPPGKKTQTYRSSWHLTEIRSPGGDTITLQYTTYLAEHIQGTHEQKFDLVQSGGGTCTPQDFVATNQHRVWTQRLTSITAAAHTVTFSAGATLRTDALSPLGAQQEPRLDLITVATPTGTVVRRFKFEHDYSTGRLTLKHVYEQDPNGVSLPPYSFTYNGTLPAITSRGQDHWGFFNGVLTNTTLIPAMIGPGGVALPGANRSPNAAQASGGILSKVTYPTGGWSEFVWEGNDYGLSLQGPLTTEVVHTKSVGPTIGDVLNFTIAGTQSVLAEVWHARGPEACEEMYFSCPHSTLTGPGINWTLTGDGHFTQTLPPGNYTLRTKRNTIGEAPPDPWATATVQWTEVVAVSKKPGGGMRVSETRAADGLGSVTIRKYKYTLQSDTTKSSGVVQFEPAYGYQFSGSNCSYYNRTSMSRLPLGDGGPLVAYREVTVWHGASGELGKTLHRFRSVADAPDQGEPGPTWYPFARATSYAWKRGQRIEAKEYTASGQIQQRTRSTHVFRDEGPSPDTATTRSLRGVSINFFNDGNLTGTPNYVFNNFAAISAWAYQNSDTTVVFDTTGTTSFATARAYTYGNPAHIQLTELTETNSDGKQRITMMKYPADFAAGSGNPEAVALTAMQGAAHIHNPVIERWVTQRVTGTDSIVRADLTVFKAYGSGQYLPSQRFVLNSPTPLTNFVPSSVAGGAFTRDSRYLLQETANTYDAYGRITQLADARGKLTDYLYGGNPNNAFLTKVTRVKDATGPVDLVTDLAYDSLGFLASISDEGGSFRHFTYDLFGRLRQIKNHGGSVVRAFGYTYSRTSPSWTFNPASPNAIVDTTFLQHVPTPKSVVSTEFLDGLGRPIQTVMRDGSSFVVTASQYDLAGRPWRSWKPYTRTTAGFDASFAANATAFYNTYHSASNAKPYVETQYRADALDRVSKVIPEYLGTSPSVFRLFGYGIDVAAKHQFTEVVDESAKKTRRFADVFGEEVKTILGYGATEATTTLSGFNMVGERLKTTDPRGLITTYALDTRGLLAAKTSPDAGAVAFKYDKSGNLRYSQDANQGALGQVFFASYDFAGRPLVSGQGVATFASLDPDAATPPALETTFGNWLVVRAYDAKPSTAAPPWNLFNTEITPLSLANVSGRVAAVASKSNGAWQATLFSYDADGRVATRHTFTQANGGASVLAALNTQVTYERDLRDALTKRLFTVGTNTFNHWYDYDNRGLLWKVFASTGPAKPATPDVTFTYRPSGQVESRQFQGGPVVPVRYTIREELEKIGNPGDASFPFSARYAYHPNGNVSESEFHSPGSPAPAKRYKYEFGATAYDALNRLKSADFSSWNGSWTSTLVHDLAAVTYDRSGNLLTLKRYRETESLVDDLSYVNSSNSNQLTWLSDAIATTPEPWDAETGAFSYDANGNVIAAPAPYAITAVTYDHQNLPVSLTSNGVASSYRYDGAGQRITKQVGGGNTEVYLLDGASSLGVVTVNGSGTPTSWFFNMVAGDRVIGRQANVGNRRYYHTDLLGSTRSVVEGAAIVESYDPEPWGLLMPGRSLGSGTKEGFTGKERDAESGLDYFGARLYMAAIGRWTGVDPLGEKHPEWSPYNYVLDNPLALFDPDGRQVNANRGPLAPGGRYVRGPVRPMMFAGAAARGGGKVTMTVVSLTPADAVATTIHDEIVGDVSVLGVLLTALPGPGGSKLDDAAEAAKDAFSAAKRGRQSETRVLEELGEKKNTQTFVTSEGNTIPDFTNSTQIGEIKDAKNVSNTSQIRAQREAANASGREHIVVTGTNTKVSKKVEEKSTVRRRDDLGPQGGNP